ncbi:MAG TPA: hypothetical protein VJ746_03055 [Nitrospira sp.]|nr:hypothetical protein [Nitrospira sp.]
MTPFVHTLLSLFLCLGSLLVLSSPTLGAAKEPKHFVVDIVAIHGEEFVVRDETGKEGKIRVGADTEQYGHVQAGDRIDAWVYPNGDAKTIMILRSGAVIRQEQERQKQAEAQERTGEQSTEERQAQR